VRDDGGGSVTLLVTPRDPALEVTTLRRRFDLGNVEIDWRIEIVDAPVRTPSGKIRLLIPPTP